MEARRKKLICPQINKSFLVLETLCLTDTAFVFLAVSSHYHFLFSAKSLRQTSLYVVISYADPHTCNILHLRPVAGVPGKGLPHPPKQIVINFVQAQQLQVYRRPFSGHTPCFRQNLIFAGCVPPTACSKA